MTPKLPPIPDEAKACFDQIKASGGNPRYYMRMGKVRVRDVAKEKPRGNHSAVRKKIASGQSGCSNAGRTRGYG